MPRVLSPADTARYATPALSSTAPVASAGTAARKLLMRATAEDNAEILTGLRDAVRNQVCAFRAKSTQGTFTDKDASALLKLAQAYALLDSRTDKEHKKYDVSSLSDEELERARADWAGNTGEKSGS